MHRLAAVVVILGLSGSALSHTYHLGACPVVEPMPGFDMNQVIVIISDEGYSDVTISRKRCNYGEYRDRYRNPSRFSEDVLDSTLNRFSSVKYNSLLGVWYVIQKTSTASHCITYNFTRTDEPGKYELEQVSQHFILGLTPLEHDYRYKGVLTVPDPSVPARMRVNFPLSVAGSASYTVLATDYTSYAAVFTCQKLAFAHRRSATVLSRSKELDKMYIDKMRSKLASYGVDPYDLSIISQSECPKHSDGEPNGVNINIQPDTFSSHNIGEAVRKTGGVIADGVEYVVEAGKKVYRKVASSKEDLTEQPAGYASNPNSDAEWLP